MAAAHDPPDGILPDLASILKSLRHGVMWTQEELAERSGVSVGTIASIESGRITRPRSASLRMLADALDLSESQRAALAAAAGSGPAPRTLIDGLPAHRLNQLVETLPAALPMAVPAQLPNAIAGFVGRVEPLRSLDDVADEAVLTGVDRPVTAVVISAVSGTPGVGKTALAVHWAHRVRDRFPDGQLYVNLRGFEPSGQEMDPGEALRGFLEALGVAQQRIPAAVDAQAALFRSMASGKRMLIVLDNARDADHVRPLLPGTAGCLVVVTSRNPLAGLVAKDGARPLTLGLLTAADAHQLLEQRLGHDRLAAEPDAAQEIVDRCARLPLALAIVAARAATHPHFPLRALADELHETQTRLDVLAGTDPGADMRAVFSWSYNQLGTAAARLFRLLLGLHPGPDISPPAAASLAGISVRQVKPLLAELTHAHLIVEHSPGRYTSHDLLRIYANELVQTHDSGTERQAAKHRMLDHYLQTACAASQFLTSSTRIPSAGTDVEPGTTPEKLNDSGQALSWFTSERVVLLRAIERAAAESLDGHTWSLASAIRPFLSVCGYPHELLKTQRLGFAAVHRRSDVCSREQADAHRNLAGAYFDLDHVEKAITHFHSALEIYRELNDQEGQGLVHRDLGLVFERQREYHRALDHSRQALSLHRYVGAQASALNNVGWYSALTGNYEQALHYCKQALVMFQELGRPNGEATTLDSLGFTHHHLGQYDEAFECYARALEIRRRIGHRYGQAVTLEHIGDTHQATGNTAAARKAWRQALEILTDLDHPDSNSVRTKLRALGQQNPP